MNEKAVSVLEQYDRNVIKSFKGRGTMICETDKGYCVLKEYTGTIQKLAVIDALQHGLSEMTSDYLIPTREGELFCEDQEHVKYILKELVIGQEMNYKDEKELYKAFGKMASMHLDFEKQKLPALPITSYVEEIEKHTMECIHVKNYLKKLKSKNDFEKKLLGCMDYFLEMQREICELAKQEDMTAYCAKVADLGCFIHGDFQYHNLLCMESDMAVINFERVQSESGVKDFYRMFRKVEEKLDWSVEPGKRMLDSYQSIRPFQAWEWRHLQLKLAYPEKFWKIVNTYANTKKSWIPDKNKSKLEDFLQQEEKRQRILKELFYL